MITSQGSGIHFQSVDRGRQDRFEYIYIRSLELTSKTVRSVLISFYFRSVSVLLPLLFLLAIEVSHSSYFVGIVCENSRDIFFVNSSVDCIFWGRARKFIAKFIVCVVTMISFSRVFSSSSSSFIPFAVCFSREDWRFIVVAVIFGCGINYHL